MPSRVALVIGIGYYEHHQNLNFCPPSATEVFELLTHPEYGNCELERSKLLASGEGKTLTATDLYQTVRDVLGSLQIGDQFVFYFSGHAELNSDNDLYLTTTESDKPYRGFHFASLVQNLRGHNVAKSILVVDACHSEAMFNSLRNLQSSTVSPGELPKGFGFIAASGKYVKARQIPELKRTLFTYYFCEGIRNGIRSEDDYITITGLKEYINSKIESKYRQYRQRVHTSSFGEGEQELWIAKNLTPKLKEPINQTLSTKRSVEVVPNQITQKLIIGVFVGLLVVLGLGIVVGRLLDDYGLVEGQPPIISPSAIVEDLGGISADGGSLPIVETSTITPLPPTFTNTPRPPTATSTDIPIPTNTTSSILDTPIPTNTPSPIPDTPIPTNTSSPIPDTPTKTPTNYDVPAGKALIVVRNGRGDDLIVDIPPYTLEIPQKPLNQQYSEASIAIEPGQYYWSAHKIGGGGYYIIDRHGNKAFEFTVAEGEVYTIGISL